MQCSTVQHSIIYECIAYGWAIVHETSVKYVIGY